MPFEHRPAGGCQPLFPLVWVLRRVVGVQEQGPAEWTAALLCLQQAQAGPVYRQGCSFTPPFGPVRGKGGVILRRPAFDHLVSDDLGPGEFNEVGSADAVAEHPLVLSGLVELAEVPGCNPAPRLVRVAMSGPLVGELPHVVGVRLVWSEAPTRVTTSA